VAASATTATAITASPPSVAFTHVRMTGLRSGAILLHHPLATAARCIDQRRFESCAESTNGHIIGLNTHMHTKETSATFARLFSELVDGTSGQGGAFILNSGDLGLLRSLDKLSPADASRTANGGATIAAHAEHVRYGLSLMNRWATNGGNPFADATWDEAWKISQVDESGWKEIRDGLRLEAHRRL